MWMSKATSVADLVHWSQCGVVTSQFACTAQLLALGIRCPVHTLETIAGFAITQEVRSTHRNAVDTSVMMEIV